MPTKNDQIKKTMKATRERRSGMVCRVFETKIVSGKLSAEKKEHLDALFREAKWLRNSELAKEDISLLDRNAKMASIKVGNDFELRPLEHLGSQMRQDIVDQIKSDIRGLAVLKAKGYKVGKLKFKPFCNMVPLRQYGTTFRIDFEKNAVSIQGFRKPFKVRGLKQIPSDAEISNAKIVRKPSGYYFHITTFCKKENVTDTGAVCGIDFGIGNNLTLDSGETINISVPESKAVKLASRRVNKDLHRNGGIKSNNHYKRKARLRRAYERQTNIKRDAANKAVSDLLKNYDFIAIQDEMIAGWHHGIFGKQVQHSAMGFIKAKLKTSSKVHVVPRSFPSTQKCPVCGKNTKHKLSERSYHCAHCGYEHPSRDVKAAAMILSEALYNVSPEQRAKSPVEARPSNLCHDNDVVTLAFVKIPPMKQEARVL